jgi:hypothetical protein
MRFLLQESGKVDKKLHMWLGNRKDIWYDGYGRSKSRGWFIGRIERVNKNLKDSKAIWKD